MGGRREEGGREGARDIRGNVRTGQCEGGRRGRCSQA